MKNKASFKALRESLGFSQQAFAEAFSVTPRSVRRWEDPGERNFPPAPAWDYLLELQDKFERAIDEAFAQIDAIEQTAGSAPDDITLVYYPNQEDYEKYCIDPDKTYYGVKNALTIATARELVAEGYQVAFKYPQD